MLPTFGGSANHSTFFFLWFNLARIWYYWHYKLISSLLFYFNQLSHKTHSIKQDFRVLWSIRTYIIFYIHRHQKVIKVYHQAHYTQNGPGKNMHSMWNTNCLSSMNLVFKEQINWIDIFLIFNLVIFTLL